MDSSSKPPWRGSRTAVPRYVDSLDRQTWTSAHEGARSGLGRIDATSSELLTRRSEICGRLSPPIPRGRRESAPVARFRVRSAAHQRFLSAPGEAGSGIPLPGSTPIDSHYDACACKEPPISIASLALTVCPKSSTDRSILKTESAVRRHAQWSYYINRRRCTAPFLSRQSRLVSVFLIPAIHQ